MTTEQQQKEIIDTLADRLWESKSEVNTSILDASMPVAMQQLTEILQNDSGADDEEIEAILPQIEQEFSEQLRRGINRAIKGFYKNHS